MRLPVDAQLPRRLASVFAAAGHDVVHTSELPSANRTPDAEIEARAIRENRIVVTKDSDFVVSFHLRKAPPKLLLISTGNIGNTELCRLMVQNLAALERAFIKHDFIELTPTAIVVHS